MLVNIGVRGGGLGTVGPEVEIGKKVLSPLVFYSLVFKIYIRFLKNQKKIKSLAPREAILWRNQYWQNFATDARPRNGVFLQAKNPFWPERAYILNKNGIFWKLMLFLIMYEAVSWKNSLKYNSNIKIGHKIGFFGQFLREKSEKFTNFSRNFFLFLATENQLSRKPLRFTY